MSAQQILFSRIDRGILVGDVVRQKDQMRLMIVQEITLGEVICGWNEYEQPSLVLARYHPSDLVLVKYGAR